MNYREIDWKKLKERYAAWWIGQLEDPIIHIETHVDKSVCVEPRPQEHEAVKKWFMDPEVRMTREMKVATNKNYYLDGFPCIDIGRINLSLSLMYNCPTNFTEHTIWVGHILQNGLDGWEDKVVFNENHELWHMTLGMAKKAMEIANGEVCITQIGGCDGILDNYSQLRGGQEALIDLTEEENYDTILAIERRFLKDFKRYYFDLYDIIKDNPKGVCLWTKALMVNGPAHCLQSDFSCMISPGMYEKLGRWYLEEQVTIFNNNIYHLDGANALQHLPMLASINKLDCIQFIHNHSGGQPLTEVVDIIEKIQATGKRVEVFSFMADDVVPFLERLKSAKGLKIMTTPKTKEQAEDMVKAIRGMGYCRD